MPTKKPRKNIFFWILGGCLSLIVIGAVIFILLTRLVNSTTDIGSNKVTPTSKPATSAKPTPAPTGQVLSKDQLIDYFIDETTTYPGVDVPMKVSRWEKEIVTLSLENTGPSYANSVIDEFIAKFNRKSKKTKLEKTESNGDIKVSFVPKIDGAGGKTGPSSGADAIIDSASVQISLETTTTSDALSFVFSHEIMHALGFVGHYLGDECRLMSGRICGAQMTTNEEKLIWMLYSSGIPLDSDATQIRDFFKDVTIQ